MAQVKERRRVGEERKETLADKPLDFENRPLRIPFPPPSFIFWLSFHSRAVKTDNPLPRSFFCSETKRQCLLGWLQFEQSLYIYIYSIVLQSLILFTDLLS